MVISQSRERWNKVWHTIENKGTLNDATKEEAEIEEYYATKKHIKMEYLM